MSIENDKAPGSLLHSLLDNQNNINYEEVRRLAGLVISGTVKIERLNRIEETGRIEGGRRNVEASLIIQAAKRKAAGGNAKAIRTWADYKELMKLQEAALEEYAKKEDIWYNYIEFEQNYGLYDQGMEAEVFYDIESEDHLIKAIGFNWIRQITPEKFIDDRISLYNYLFPESKYVLLGFTRDNKGFLKFVVRQQFMERGGDVSVTELEAHNFEKLNMKAVNDNKTKYANEDHIIDDLHLKNIIKLHSGHITFIDTIPSLNTMEDLLDANRNYLEFNIVSTN